MSAPSPAKTEEKALEVAGAVASRVIENVYMASDGLGAPVDPKRTQLSAWIAEDGPKRYHVAPYGGDGWLPAAEVDPMARATVPDIVQDRIFRTRAAARAPRLGLWTEIHRAYAFSENRLVIWRYETGSGLVTLPPDAPIRAAITAVGLCVPRSATFDSHTRYLLVVCTVYNVLLFPVSFSGGSVRGELRLGAYEAELEVVNDGAEIVAVAGTRDGRVFLADAAGQLRELVYQSARAFHSSWSWTLGLGLSRRVELRTRSSQSYSGVMRSYLGFDLPALGVALAPRLVDVAVDHARDSLYTLDAAGCIRLYRISFDAATGLSDVGIAPVLVKSLSLAEMVAAARRLRPPLETHSPGLMAMLSSADRRGHPSGAGDGTGMRGALWPIRSLHILPPWEDRSVHVVAVCESGMRLYFSSLQERRRAPLDAKLVEKRHCACDLRLVHIRPPPTRASVDAALLRKQHAADPSRRVKPARRGASFAADPSLDPGADPDASAKGLGQVRAAGYAGGVFALVGITQNTSSSSSTTSTTPTPSSTTPTPSSSSSSSSTSSSSSSSSALASILAPDWVGRDAEARAVTAQQMHVKSGLQRLSHPAMLGLRESVSVVARVGGPCFAVEEVPWTAPAQHSPIVFTKSGALLLPSGEPVPLPPVGAVSLYVRQASRSSLAPVAGKRSRDAAFSPTSTPPTPAAAATPPSSSSLSEWARDVLWSFPDLCEAAAQEELVAVLRRRDAQVGRPGTHRQSAGAAHVSKLGASMRDGGGYMRSSWQARVRGQESIPQPEFGAPYALHSFAEQLFAPLPRRVVVLSAHSALLADVSRPADAVAAALANVGDAATAKLHLSRVAEAMSAREACAACIALWCGDLFPRLSPTAAAAKAPRALQLRAMRAFQTLGLPARSGDAARSDAAAAAAVSGDTGEHLGPEGLPVRFSDQLQGLLLHTARTLRPFWKETLLHIPGTTPSPTTTSSTSSSSTTSSSSSSSSSSTRKPDPPAVPRLGAEAAPLVFVWWSASELEALRRRLARLSEFVREAFGRESGGEAALAAPAGQALLRFLGSASMELEGVGREEASDAVRCEAAVVDAVAFVVDRASQVAASAALLASDEACLELVVGGFSTAERAALGQLTAEAASTSWSGASMLRSLLLRSSDALRAARPRSAPDGLATALRAAAPSFFRQEDAASKRARAALAAAARASDRAARARHRAAAVRAVAEASARWHLDNARLAELEDIARDAASGADVDGLVEMCLVAVAPDSAAEAAKVSAIASADAALLSQRSQHASRPSLRAARAAQTTRSQLATLDRMEGIAAANGDGSISTPWGDSVPLVRLADAKVLALAPPLQALWRKREVARIVIATLVQLWRQQPATLNQWFLERFHGAEASRLFTARSHLASSSSSSSSSSASSTSSRGAGGVDARAVWTAVLQRVLEVSDPVWHETLFVTLVPRPGRAPLVPEALSALLHLRHFALEEFMEHRCPSPRVRFEYLCAHGRFADAARLRHAEAMLPLDEAAEAAFLRPGGAEALEILVARSDGSRSSADAAAGLDLSLTRSRRPRGGGGDGSGSGLIASPASPTGGGGGGGDGSSGVSPALLAAIAERPVLLRDRVAALEEAVSLTSLPDVRAAGHVRPEEATRWKLDLALAREQARIVSELHSLLGSGGGDAGMAELARQLDTSPPDRARLLETADRFSLVPHFLRVATLAFSAPELRPAVLERFRHLVKDAADRLAGSREIRRAMEEASRRVAEAGSVLCAPDAAFGLGVADLADACATLERRVSQLRWAPESLRRADLAANSRAVADASVYVKNCDWIAVGMLDAFGKVPMNTRLRIYADLTARARDPFHKLQLLRVSVALVRVWLDRSSQRTTPLSQRADFLATVDAEGGICGYWLALLRDELQGSLAGAREERPLLEDATNTVLGDVHALEEAISHFRVQEAHRLF